MKKIFSIILSFLFLFFFSGSVVFALQECVRVPYCNGSNDTTVSRCFYVDEEATIVFETSKLGNYYFKSDIISVDPDSRMVREFYNIPVPQITGFRFLGWYYGGQMITDTRDIHVSFGAPTYVNGSVCEFDANDNVIGESVVTLDIYTTFRDINLEAQWEPIPVTVAYTLPDGSVTIHDYVSDELTTRIFENVDSNSKYTWYYDSEFKNPVSGEIIGELEFVPIYGDDYYGFGEVATDYEILTIFAKEPASCIGDNNFNLFYNTNGGDEYNSEVVDVSSVNDQEKEKLPTPTKTGYKFEGWYYDSELKNKVETEFKVELRIGTEPDENGCPMFKDITLYAKWVADASQVPDGDDAINGALDPSEGGNSSGVEDDDIPNTGAGASLVALIIVAALTSCVYIYVLKHDRIKRLV